MSDERPTDVPRPAASATPAPDVVVRRSARRKRSVTAFREGGRTVVVIPDTMSERDEAEWVARMVDRVEARRRPRASDADLAARAAELSRRYLGGRAVPASVRWVTNQNTRWGSCTPLDGTIRISHHVQEMPEWVLDSVLVHELAHLIERGHGPRFQALVASYPHTDRARGFLEGAVHVWSGGRRGAGPAG